VKKTLLSALNGSPGLEMMLSADFLKSKVPVFMEYESLSINRDKKKQQERLLPVSITIRSNGCALIEANEVQRAHPR
jgi:hypothetical protein